MQLPARVPLEIVVNISTNDLNTGIERTPIKQQIHEDSEMIRKCVEGQEQNSKPTL